ncbi:MAG TPA: lysophospholipid acyltransferase family protein [Candidatus Rubrimentiphilum sp.]|nr:lysophospholipid acyltransferase family protein [Candidatus Rubrimentiphilum sp.]
MSNGLYDLAKFLCRTLFTVWRMRVYGAQNVPRDGPLIVACNHVSYFDPPVLGTACPRRIRYMAKRELFTIPILGPLIARLGAYPVDRTGSPMSAIRRSVEMLRRGDAIGVFPEGTRNLDGTVQAREGVALLASLGQAPVVPAVVLGTRQAGRLRRFKVIFGPPMRLPGNGKAGREMLANFTEQVMHAIVKLPETIGGD